MKPFPNQQRSVGRSLEAVFATFESSPQGHHGPLWSWMIHVVNPWVMAIELIWKRSGDWGWSQIQEARGLRFTPWEDGALVWRAPILKNTSESKELELLWLLAVFSSALYALGTSPVKPLATLAWQWTGPHLDDFPLSTLGNSHFLTTGCPNQYQSTVSLANIKTYQSKSTNIIGCPRPSPKTAIFMATTKVRWNWGLYSVTNVSNAASDLFPGKAKHRSRFA